MSDITQFGAFTKPTADKLLATGTAPGSQVFSVTSPDFYRFNGMTKFINRPTTDAFVVQVKSEPTSTAAAHAGVESTVDWKAAGASGYLRAVQGVARLKSTFTATGGTLIGTYGQVAVDGTVNGSGIFLAANYSLIEDGGTYTAVNHVCAQWLDSHLTKTVTAGRKSFQYISNNGSTTFNQVSYIYGGNKITYWAAFDTCGTMVDTGGTLGGTLKKIAISIDGTPYYLIAGTTVS